MKKFLFIAFVLFSATFAACAQGNKKSDDKTADKSATVYLTTADFKAKVWNYEANSQVFKFEGKKPVLIDFYATWCGPCKKLAPVLEEVAKEYEGKIVVYKVDVDKETELSAGFGITSVPTLMFIPMEGQPTMIPGAPTKEQLVDLINKTLLIK